MNRFILFAGNNYYPEGGWRDFVGAFETFEEADSFAPSLNKVKLRTSEFPVYDWWHVVDSQTGQVWHG